MFKSILYCFLYDLILKTWNTQWPAFIASRFRYRCSSGFLRFVASSGKLSAQPLDIIIKILSIILLCYAVNTDSFIPFQSSERRVQVTPVRDMVHQCIESALTIRARLLSYSCQFCCHSILSLFLSLNSELIIVYLSA